MPDHFYPAAAHDMAQGNWGWENSVFYMNIVVGDPSVAYNSLHTSYADVLTTPNLFEYTHASYVPDKLIFALSANLLGGVTPSAPPQTITYTALGANTAGGGANMRAVVWCRRVTGAPLSSDPCVLWLEDNLTWDPGTSSTLIFNGDGTDFPFTWTSVLTYASVFDKFYDIASRQILDGTWNWGTASAQGRLYMKILVGPSSVAHDPTDLTVGDVLATANLSEYTGAGYVSNEVLPPLTILPGTGTVASEIQPTTLPWEQQYTNLFPNTAQSGANVRAILIARRVGAAVATSDPPVCWLERSVGVDPTDGSPLKLNGARVNAFVNWPGRLAAIGVS